MSPTAKSAFLASLISPLFAILGGIVAYALMALPIEIIHVNWSPERFKRAILEWFFLGIPIAYAYVLIYGLPAHFIFRHKNWLSYSSYALAGVFGGSILGVIIIEPGFILFGFFSGLAVASAFWYIVRSSNEQ